MNRKFLPYFKSLLTLLIITFLFQACDLKKKAKGNEDDIHVLADSADFYELEPVLVQVFEKKIFTPQQENLFNIVYHPFEDLEKLKDQKNILITAPLSSGGNVANYVSSILDTTVKSMINNGEEYLINKYDLWAKDQLVMVLTSPTMESLKNNILSSNENLLHYFRKISNDRLFQSLYNPKYEKKKIEANILKNYGWMIYVQADFMLAKESAKENFVWLRRAPGSDMERWIFVHWIENANPNLLNPDSILAIRNDITKKFYRSSDNENYVEFEEQLINQSEVNFLGRYAVMTQGLWKMNDLSMGGPFINYSFIDEETGRMYMLDGSIYAPKYYKKKLIQQVDVLMKSFLTESEIPEDKKQDLLDELE